MSEILFWQKIIRQGQRVAGLVQRPMTLGVRAIALDEAGRVFLVRHTYVPGFHLPGGAVERGETAIDSLLRELEEEGGLVTDEDAAADRILFQPAPFAPRPCRALSGAGRPPGQPPAPNWEIVESGFFPLDALPAGATASTRARIAEYLQQASPASIW